jgi:hypothetical protein
VGRRDREDLDDWLEGLPAGTREFVIGYGARDPDFLAALRDQGPHARALWVKLLEFVARKLEGLMATQDPPLPAPQSSEEWWSAVDDVALRFFQRIRPLLLLSFADASARDGDGEVMSNVTKDLLFPGVISNVGGLDEARQRVALRWLSDFEYIARDSQTDAIRSNPEVRRYLATLVQSPRVTNGEPLNEATTAPEAEEDDLDALYELLFEAVQAAGATPAEWELLQALRGEGTIAGAARSIGIREETARVRFHRLKQKIQAAL